MALPVPHDRPLIPVMLYDQVYFTNVSMLVPPSDLMLHQIPNVAAQIINEAAKHTHKSLLRMFCYNLLVNNQFDNEYFKELLTTVVFYAEHTFHNIKRGTLDECIDHSVKMVVSLFTSTLVFKFPDLKSLLDFKIVEAASQNAPKYTEIKNLISGTNMHQYQNPQFPQQPYQQPAPIVGYQQQAPQTMGHQQPYQQPQQYPQPVGYPQQFAQQQYPQPMGYQQPYQQPQQYPQQPYQQPAPIVGYQQQFPQPVQPQPVPFPTNSPFQRPNTTGPVDVEAANIRQGRFAAPVQQQPIVQQPQQQQPAMNQTQFLQMAEELEPKDDKPKTVLIIPKESVKEFMNREKHSVPYLGYQLRMQRPIENIPKQISYLTQEDLNDIDNESVYLHKKVFTKNCLQEFLYRCHLESSIKRNENEKTCLLTRYVGIITNSFFGGSETKLITDALMACKSMPDIVTVICDSVQAFAGAQKLELDSYEQISFSMFVDRWVTKEINHFLIDRAHTTWTVDSFSLDWQDLSNLFDQPEERDLAMAVEAFGVNLIMNLRKAFDTTDIIECVKIQNEIEEDIPVGALPYWVTNTQLHINDAEFGTGMKTGEIKQVTYNVSPTIMDICKSLKSTNNQLEVKALHNYITTMDQVCYEIVADAYNPENFYLKRLG